MEVRQRNKPKVSINADDGDGAAADEGEAPQKLLTPSAHVVLQNRLRSVSQEEDELRIYAPSRENSPVKGVLKDMTSAGMPGLEPVDTAPIREEKSSDHTESLHSKLKDLHDDLESWGYNNFPVITDHFNFLVYTIDLAVRSVRWFQFGFMAVWLGFRLCLYACMLLPAFVRIMLTYYHDPRIHRRIRFGPAEREYLDIYVPVEALQEGAKLPVVIAIMGGAFIIGHRGYNAQLGLRLMDVGVITVGIDYRNFPRGCIPDMVEDVSRGVRWVFQNIERYGGDPSTVLLLGQSAGAHLAAMLLLGHCLLEAQGHDEQASKVVDTWSVKDLKGFVGISGPYHLGKLRPHLASRGLYPAILHHITGGDEEGCSPEALFDHPDWKAHGELAASLLPPIHIFHGDQDKAVPVWSSEQFAAAMKRAGVKCTLDVRKGMTHTYPVVEGPMRRHDPQVEVLLPMLLGPGAEKRLESSPKLPPMWPIPILDVAGCVSPF
eukprot:TRINITY_DN41017_c0_g1_i1.p1 TRINITY_DN41017_c0_g1~~TRINITY_DN41017_c0_g1_i1.p1  ORF type:complete len:499 (-),score=98.31 TRINITY_DN41017_c0_g1_i1:56-1525(-)